MNLCRKEILEPLKGAPGVSGEYIVLSIQDNGTGIAPEIQSRIFEPFFTTKSSGKGTGLGLSTVKSVMERCGGFVTVDSALGHGARFDLYFPA
ncbi:MAG: HAMP domain-containing histidine kinase [Verrucomicrobia bacterium]|nr:HAMP domain-containing histidine kinase [Verrucomicrobiota bacterium]